MAKKANETTSQITESTTEEEEEYLTYNMYDNTINITMAENCTIIFQTGRPKDPPPGP